jgi:hypothetical protein
MLHLGKRSWRPYAGLSAALLSLAVVLSIPGSAGATSKAGVAPRPAAVAPRASAISPAGELASTSSIRGVTRSGTLVTGRFKPLSSRVNSAGRLVVRGRLNMLIHRATPVRVSTIATLPVRTVNSARAASTAAGTAAGAAAAAAAPAACNILHLVLGPLHLNLLGLVIDLNRVVLNITALPGPGNLLGNLLCAVAHLLDGTPLAGQLAQISALLNSILAILNQ